MTERKDPRRPVTQPGTSGRLLTGIAQCLKWLVLSLAFSIVIEWIGMLFWWEEQGLQHSRQMFTNELHYLGEDFKRSIITSNPLQFAQRVVDGIYYALFEFTHLDDLIHWLAQPVEGDGFRVSLHQGYETVANFVLAALQIAQVFSVRLAILMLATPVFGLVALVGLVDGLVRRDLRRWGGGRESSFVYHYTKKVALPLIMMAWVIYLSLPFSLHPSWVILPFALGFGFAVTVTASTFKKYL